MSAPRRSPVRDAFEGLWREEGGRGAPALAIAATPLAALFGAGVRARNLLHDAGLLPVRGVGVPVVSVGNLSVGGTGKTPIAAWLARTLRSVGFRPALLLRGYGEDEVLLHRRWNPEIPVFVNPDRVAGAREAVGAGCDLLLLDDGFQHRRLHRDLDLVVLSPGDPLPVHLLPRGPYREPLESLRRADRVLVTAKGEGELERAERLLGRVREIPGAPPVHLFRLLPGGWTDLEGAPAAPPVGPPLVVTSIGQPAGFLRLVEERAGPPAGHLRYPDHHAYDRAEAAVLRAGVERAAAHRGAGAPGWIATTEKDAVKLAPFRELLPEVRVLPLVPAPDEGLARTLVEAVGSA